jgi:hypothetical protein
VLMDLQDRNGRRMQVTMSPRFLSLGFEKITNMHDYIWCDDARMGAFGSRLTLILSMQLRAVVCFRSASFPICQQCSRGVYLSRSDSVPAYSFLGLIDEIFSGGRPGTGTGTPNMRRQRCPFVGAEPVAPCASSSDGRLVAFGCSVHYFQITTRTPEREYNCS